VTYWFTVSVYRKEVKKRLVLEVKKSRPIWEILFSTHHTDVCLLCIITSITFLMMGGALAMSMRTDLFLPGQQVFPSGNDFGRFFTVHGTTMLLLWVIPFGAGVGNYLIPIMIRYKDMAWLKLNAVAYWMIPVAAALIWLGFSYWLDCLSSIFHYKIPWTCN
jgi:cytochrome c oxidase subunit I